MRASDVTWQHHEPSVTLATALLHFGHICVSICMLCTIIITSKCIYKYVQGFWLGTTYLFHKYGIATFYRFSLYTFPLHVFHSMFFIWISELCSTSNALIRVAQVFAICIWFDHSVHFVTAAKLIVASISQHGFSVRYSNAIGHVWRFGFGTNQYTVTDSCCHVSFTPWAHPFVGANPWCSAW